MVYIKVDEEPVRHILFHNARNEKVEHVIVFLCGKGERGNDLDDLFKTGLPKVLKDSPGFKLPNTVVMCCQLPVFNAWTWDNETLSQLIVDYVSANWHSAKLHLTGLSLGGQGVFFMAENYVIDSAGIIAGFTWQRISTVLPDFEEIPTYICHGNRDNVVNRSAIKLGNQLVDSDKDCELHVLNAGHSVWNWAYKIGNEQGYLEWFRRKFLQNGTQPPQEPKEFIPVDLDSLNHGDFVFSPNGDRYLVTGIRQDNLIVAMRSDIVDENWKERNPNY